MLLLLLKQYFAFVGLVWYKFDKLSIYF